LAFKPQTDDIREAPALENIDVLLEEGAVLRVHDPEASNNVEKKYGDRLIYCNAPLEAAAGADLLFIATEWQQFRSPDFTELGQLMKGKIIVDGRNLYNLEEIKEKGFKYFSVGRKPIE